MLQHGWTSEDSMLSEINKSQNDYILSIYDSTNMKFHKSIYDSTYMKYVELSNSWWFFDTGDGRKSGVTD